MARLLEWIQAQFRKKSASPPALEDMPDWYRDYFARFKAIPHTTPVSEITFVVYDTETTGLDPRTDRMVSIGGLQIKGDLIKTDAPFACFLNPDLAFKKTDAVRIHGVLPSSGFHVYLSESEALMNFLDWLPSRCVLVAHHLGFDRTMIDMAIQRFGGYKLLNDGADTVQMAKKLQPAAYYTPDDAYALDHLARQFRIPLSDRHTALGDSYITAILFLKLLHRLEDRKGQPLLLEDIL